MNAHDFDVDVGIQRCALMLAYLLTPYLSLLTIMTAYAVYVNLHFTHFYSSFLICFFFVYICIQSSLKHFYIWHPKKDISEREKSLWRGRKRKKNMRALIRHENFFLISSHISFPLFNFLSRSLSFYISFHCVFPLLSWGKHKHQSRFKIYEFFQFFPSFYSSFFFCFPFFLCVCVVWLQQKTIVLVMLWMKNEYVCIYNTPDDDKETGDRMKTLKYIILNDMVSKQYLHIFMLKDIINAYVWVDVNAQVKNLTFRYDDRYELWIIVKSFDGAF